MKKTILLILVIACVIACKKDDPEPDNTTPAPNPTPAMTYSDTLALWHGDWITEVGVEVGGTPTGLFTIHMIDSLNPDSMEVWEDVGAGAYFICQNRLNFDKGGDCLGLVGRYGACGASPNLAYRFNSTNDTIFYSDCQNSELSYTYFFTRVP